jgi:hypothetical protein
VRSAAEATAAAATAATVTSVSDVRTRRRFADDHRILDSYPITDYGTKCSSVSFVSEYDLKFEHGT